MRSALDVLAALVVALCFISTVWGQSSVASTSHNESSCHLLLPEHCHCRTAINYTSEAQRHACKCKSTKERVVLFIFSREDPSSAINSISYFFTVPFICFPFLLSFSSSVLWLLFRTCRLTRYVDFYPIAFAFLGSAFSLMMIQVVFIFCIFAPALKRRSITAAMSAEDVRCEHCDHRLELLLHQVPPI